MLFKVTKKEYKKLNEKYKNAIDRIEELEIIKKSLIQDKEKLKMKLDEAKYREQVLEQEYSQLVNVISNSLEIRNQLNLEIIKLKKNKRKKE